MKINRLLLPIGKVVKYNEDIDFSKYQGDPYHVKRINSCHLELNVTNYDELIILSFDVKGEVVTSCAYTLEEINYPYHIKEEIELSGSEEDEFEMNGDIIDIDNILITLIVSSIPMKVIKKGAKLPESGDGYRVISEEEALKEKKPSCFDVLDDLEFED